MTKKGSKKKPTLTEKINIHLLRILIKNLVVHTEIKTQNLGPTKARVLQHTNEKTIRVLNANQNSKRMIRSARTINTKAMEKNARTVSRVLMAIKNPTKATSIKMTEKRDLTKVMTIKNITVRSQNLMAIAPRKNAPTINHFSIKAKRDRIVMISHSRKDLMSLQKKNALSMMI